MGIAAFFALAMMAGSALAQQPPISEVDVRDPWVPPSVREKARAAPPVPQTRGAALQAQVDEKLRKRFEAAAGPGGKLTREQARASGLGAIAADFEAIDRGGRGAVSFDDYRAYLRERSNR
jgi:hypothetical protein